MAFSFREIQKLETADLKLENPAQTGLHIRLGFHGFSPFCSDIVRLAESRSAYRMFLTLPLPAAACFHVGLGFHDLAPFWRFFRGSSSEVIAMLPPLQGEVHGASVKPSELI